jgi:hypothetical protein
MKLQPCPRCGKDAAFVEIGDEIVIWQVNCQHCAMRALAALDQEGAAKSWARICKIIKGEDKES